MGLLTSTDGGIRILTLNRPEKRNAMNDELIAALKYALREADADESLRAVIIRGAGKDFCSGADLAVIQKIAGATYEENVEDARQLAELFELPRKMRAPVIAAVRGKALAGGFGLALACDMIFAHEDAIFGFPEVKIGFVPAMVAAMVRRSFSEKEAFAMLTFGYEMHADELRERGLIEGTIHGEDFDSEVVGIAKKYEKLSGSAVAMTKRLLYDIDSLPFADAISVGVETNARARMTEDCKKGIARFLKK